MIPSKNPEGYRDPTAQAAMQHIWDEEEGRHRRLISELRHIIHADGFEIVGHIILKDRKSGRIYR